MTITSHIDRSQYVCLIPIYKMQRNMINQFKYNEYQSINYEFQIYFNFSLKRPSFITWVDPLPNLQAVPDGFKCYSC
jgi:hypothetical protein